MKTVFRHRIALVSFTSKETMYVHLVHDASLLPKYYSDDFLIEDATVTVSDGQVRIEGTKRMHVSGYWTSLRLRHSSDPAGFRHVREDNNDFYPAEDFLESDVPEYFEKRDAVKFWEMFVPWKQKKMKFMKLEDGRTYRLKATKPFVMYASKFVVKRDEFEKNEDGTVTLNNHAEDYEEL